MKTIYRIANVRKFVLVHPASLRRSQRRISFSPRRLLVLRSPGDECARPPDPRYRVFFSTARHDRSWIHFRGSNYFYGILSRRESYALLKLWKSCSLYSSFHAFVHTASTQQENIAPGRIHQHVQLPPIYVISWNIFHSTYSRSHLLLFSRTCYPDFRVNISIHRFCSLVTFSRLVRDTFQNPQSIMWCALCRWNLFTNKYHYIRVVIFLVQWPTYNIESINFIQWNSSKVIGVIYIVL